MASKVVPIVYLGDRKLNSTALNPSSKKFVARFETAQPNPRQKKKKMRDIASFTQF